MKDLLRASLFMVLLFGIVVLTFYVVSKYKKEDKSKIKMVIHYYNNDTPISVQDQQIILPQNSVQLDYQTDTIYIHDTIYKTKIINDTQIFFRPIEDGRDYIESVDTTDIPLIIKHKYETGN